jgi:hypothetical protein
MECTTYIIPTILPDDCGGERKDAKCIIDENVYIDLGIEANSSQQDINQSVYNALQASKTTTDELQIQVDEIVSQSIIIPNDISIASALNEGKLRYYVSGNNSYLDICMLTGIGTYSWVNILQNNF